jgi:tetratricopeptide (TPR) repeat protein
MKIIILLVLSILSAVSGANIDEDYLICREFEKKKDWPKVIDYCDKSIKNKPEGNNPYYKLCLAHSMVGNNEKALENCTIVIVRKKLSLDLQYSSYYYRALAGYNLKYYDKAISDIDNAITLNKKGMAQYILQGKIRYSLSEYKKADISFSHVINQDRNNYTATYGRYLARLKLGNYKGAYTDITYAIDINKTKEISKLYVLRGIVSSKLSRHKQSFADFDHALSIDSTNYNSHIGIAKLKHKLCDYYGAIRSYNHAIKLSVNNSSILTHRADSWSELGEYKKAFADCNLAIKIDANYAEAYYMRGIIQLKRNILDNKGLYDLSIAANLGMFEVYKVLSEIHNERKSIKLK